MTGWDVVVVGGGGAGAVLAARLSEDPARRVLLLEAGPVPQALADWPPDLLDAGRVPGAVPGDPRNRWFPARLTAGREYAVTRGRVLGGSTTTNGAYFVRPRRADFARWSAHGDADWSWEQALPRMRALERDLDHDASAVHGDRGPMPVRRAPLDHPAADAFVAASLAAGHAEERDKNDEGPPGVGAVPSNAVHGVRWNTGLAYLLGAAARPNLEIRGGCAARRVVLAAGRAVAVEADGPRGRTVFAADQVVLSAGALASPAILLRSGVGPADDLRSAGVAVAVDAPGVGTAFGDHPQVTVEWRPRPGLPHPVDGWTGGLLTVAADDPSGDLEVLQSLVPMAELTGGPPDPAAPLGFLVSVQTPVSHGRLRLRDADPDSAAAIDFGYLADADDRRRMRHAVRATTEVLAAPPFREVSAGVVDLDAAVVLDDARLDEWIRARLGTALHTCGTVPFRMRDGAPGPVDQGGAVRGLAGLRVADTSILPTAPLRGPALAAVLVGETIAAAVRA